MPSEDEIVTGAEEYPALVSFEDFDFDESLLRGIYAYGFERPSTLQRQGIQPILAGRDTIVQSRSGTGKTAALTIGCLQRIDFGLIASQAFILTYSRERAANVKSQLLGLGDFLHVKCFALGLGEGIDKLRDGQHVVVGTPGRVLELFGKRHLRVDDVVTVVLDHADEMLSRGFKDHIHDIFKTLPSHTQVCLSSSTTLPELLDLTTEFTRDAVSILVTKHGPTSEGVRQFYVAVEKEEWKLDSFCGLAEAFTTTQAVIYCNTRRKVDFLADQLSKRGVSVATLRGSSQEERDLLARELRSGSSRALVSTDLVGPGIGVAEVPLVINYDLPADIENYLRRVGHDGRSARKGVAISLVTGADVERMRDIEKLLHTQIEEMPMPLDIAGLV